MPCIGSFFVKKATRYERAAAKGGMLTMQENPACASFTAGFQQLEAPDEPQER